MLLFRRRAAQARYLSQAIQLEEAVNPLLLQATTFVISLTVLAFIAWSSITDVHEVSRTSGEIVPEGMPRVVQSLEGGSVQALSVKEGDRVVAGQDMLVLEGTGATEDLSRAKVKQVSLALQEERLRAFIEKRQPDFSKFGKKSDNLIKDQMNFYQEMQATHADELQILNQQISQKQRVLAGLSSDLKMAQKNHAIAQSVLDKRTALNREGYTSQIKLLETEQNLNSLEGQIAQTRQRMAATNDEIVEFQKRRNHITTDANNQASERLDSLLAEKAQNDEMITKLSTRVARQSVKAPIAGVVQGLTVNTLGAVVAPGQTIMEIVPDDQKLLVQVKIPPKDIGHIAPGQKVHVKLSSFDFSRYGVALGELKQVSATTFSGEGGERFYQGTIHLDKMYVGNDKHARILPGMTVMADIITGDKTVLEYLLKPINNAFKTAFTER